MSSVEKNCKSKQYSSTEEKKHVVPRWYHRLRYQSHPTDRKQVEEAVECLGAKIQKSFDAYVDKALKKNVKLALSELSELFNFDQNVQEILKERIIYYMVKKSFKRFDEQKSKEKKSTAPSFQEIVEYCSKGHYRQLGNTFDSVPREGNTYKEPSERLVQIFWDITKIEPNSQFCFEFEANKAFGVGRQRLVHRHPHLIHYVLDKEDCQWLREADLWPENYDKSRLSIVLYKDLCELVKSEEMYRKYESDIDLKHLTRFTVSASIRRKITFFIIHLQIKTNGAITIVRPKTVNLKSSKRSVFKSNLTKASSKEKGTKEVESIINQQEKVTGCSKNQKYTQSLTQPLDPYRSHHFDSMLVESEDNVSQNTLVSPQVEPENCSTNLLQSLHTDTSYPNKSASKETLMSGHSQSSSYNPYKATPNSSDYRMWNAEKPTTSSDKTSLPDLRHRPRTQCSNYFPNGSFNSQNSVYTFKYPSIHQMLEECGWNQ